MRRTHGMSSSDKYFLRSKRLGFRSWAERDLGLAVGLWGDSAVVLLIDSCGSLSEAQVRERLSGEVAIEREHGVQYWPVFLLGTGDHIGCCGLRPCEREGGILEIGVRFARTGGDTATRRKRRGR